MPKPDWVVPDPKPTRVERVKQKAARRRAVKPKSDKRRDEQAVYSAFRLAYLERVHFECEAKVTGVCTGQATQIHHKRGRAGADFLRASLYLAACTECHEWITTHPAEAIELGLSERRNVS